MHSLMPKILRTERQSAAALADKARFLAAKSKAECVVGWDGITRSGLFCYYEYISICTVCIYRYMYICLYYFFTVSGVPNKLTVEKFTKR